MVDIYLDEFSMEDFYLDVCSMEEIFHGVYFNWIHFPLMHFQQRLFYLEVFVHEPGSYFTWRYLCMNQEAILPGGICAWTRKPFYLEVFVHEPGSYFTWRYLCMNQEAVFPSLVDSTVVWATPAMSPPQKTQGSLVCIVSMVTSGRPQRFSRIGSSAFSTGKTTTSICQVIKTYSLHDYQGQKKRDWSRHQN